MHPIIELTNVGVSVGGGVTDTTLLSPVSASIAAGSIVALRGANGSGKTTLLRILAGITRPTIGSAHVLGVPPNERDPIFRRRVAAMIGLPPLAADLTVADHFALLAATWNRSESSPANQPEIPHEFGLTRIATRYPGELSSGQTQLVGLALVMSRPFDVLLLDEPEQRLDPDRVEMLAHALDICRRRGSTVVAATHSMKLTDLVADDTIALTNAAA